MIQMNIKMKDLSRVFASITGFMIGDYFIAPAITSRPIEDENVVKFFTYLFMWLVCWGIYGIRQGIRNNHI